MSPDWLPFRGPLGPDQGEFNLKDRSIFTSGEDGQLAELLHRGPVQIIRGSRLDRDATNEYTLDWETYNYKAADIGPLAPSDLHSATIWNGLPAFAHESSAHAVRITNSS